MKRILTIVLVLVMLLCLVACSSGGSSAKPGSSTAPVDTEQGDASVSAGEPTESVNEGETVLPLVDETYTFSYFQSVWPEFFTGYTDYGEMEFMKELERRTNVHINFTTISEADFETPCSVMLAGGDYTDFFGRNVSRVYNGGAAQAVADGVFMDISELVYKYAPNYVKAIEDYDIVNEVALAGGAMPLFYNIEEEYLMTAGIGPWVRQDWLDELNMEVPVTYDDWYNVLTAFKTEYGCDMALDILSADCGAGTASANFICNGYEVNTCMHFFGGNWQNFIVRDGSNVEYSFRLEGAREYYTMMHKWYSEGLIYSDYYSTRTDAARMGDYSANRSGLFFWAFPNTDLIINTAKENGNKNFALSAVRDPVKEKSQQLHLGQYGTHAANPAHAISSSCSDPALAVRYIDYLYSDEGSFLRNYGIEDKSYYYDDAGEMHYTDFILHPQYTLDVACIMYAGGSGFQAINDAASRNMTLSDTGKQYVIWDEGRDIDWVIPTSMQWDADDFTEYTLLMTDVNTYVAENALSFVVGEKSLDEWDAFIDGLNKTGIDDALSIVQKTYDANYK